MGIFNEHRSTSSSVTVSSGEGPRGAPGPAGPRGAPGPAGSKGDDGNGFKLNSDGNMTWKTRSSQMFETEIMIMMSWLKVR